MTTFALISLFADSDNWDMHGSGWWAPMMIGMTLFWGAIILGIVWLARSASEHQSHRTETALSVLDRRFAEGALSPDDYHQRRSILTGGAASHRDGAGRPESEVR